MSQQINLINPELRPRRDALSFSVIAPVSLAMVLLMAVAVVWLQDQQRGLLVRDGELAGQVKAAQARLQGAAKIAGGHQVDAELVQEAQRLTQELQGRRDVAQHLQSGKMVGVAGFSAILSGLARQTAEGLWLTGLSISGGEMELRGRVLDAALLPAYIHRLNAEPAFQGRHFAELGMQEGGLPGESTKQQSAPAAPAEEVTAPQHLQRFVEFRLRTSAAVIPASKGGGER